MFSKLLFIMILRSSMSCFADFRTLLRVTYMHVRARAYTHVFADSFETTVLKTLREI